MNIEEINFEWDDDKNEINKKKHRISFELASRIFLDDKRLEKFDIKNSSLEEERWDLIGVVSERLVLFVTITERNDTVRIITARKAEPNEVREYYENYEAR